MTKAAPITQTVEGADGAKITFSLEKRALQIDYAAGQDRERKVFIALGIEPNEGSPVVPFAAEFEGSTMFLPFPANQLYLVQAGTDASKKFKRTWNGWSWSDRSAGGEEIDVKVLQAQTILRLPASTFGANEKIKLAIYSKDFTNEKAWGHFFGCSDTAATAGGGDKYIPHYYELNLAASAPPFAERKGRLGADLTKVRIYQLFVRLFGNTNETRKQNGTLAENGVGKFNDVNEAAITSIKQMGFTHVWLTGVLQQATGTDYSQIGQPADDPDLLKGIAGSPYAIKDYFDVCPDYAERPAERLKEFRALLDRLHTAGLKALIDLVPNHVARSYNSDVRPDLNFGSKGHDGKGDDRTKFFDPANNFFYLTPGHDGPPLRLPTCQDGSPVSPTCRVAGLKCDGLFDGEKDHGKVTGNNAATWRPGLGDWYETVKLNYGFDFTDQSKETREYPNAQTPDKPVPDTWKKMDAIIAYWQSLGIDGFRCDMSHMIPSEFWSWTIARARSRDASVFFMAEAYDDDPAKLPCSNPVVAALNHGRGNVSFDLLNAGFNVVYDAPAYRALKKVYEGPGWANDIDAAASDEFIFHNSLRYVENHDEVRIAARHEWGGVGMNVGKPVAAILYGMSRGASMVYNGQEVGEPGEGNEGFGGDDSRTSIFDYWSMPEFVKWTNDHKYDGGRLSPEQKQLREFYSRLLNVTGEPAFRDGGFFPLNRANHDNPKFGRLGEEVASGHWLYSFLRFDHKTKQRFLVIVNLNPATTLKDVSVIMDQDAIAFLQLATIDPKTPLVFQERLATTEPITATSCINEASTTGVWIGDIAPLTALYFEMQL